MIETRGHLLLRGRPYWKFFFTYFWEAVRVVRVQAPPLHRCRAGRIDLIVIVAPAVVDKALLLHAGWELGPEEPPQAIDTHSDYLYIALMDLD